MEKDVYKLQLQTMDALCKVMCTIWSNIYIGLLTLASKVPNILVAYETHSLSNNRPGKALFCGPSRGITSSVGATQVGDLSDIDNTMKDADYKPPQKE